VGDLDRAVLLVFLDRSAVIVYDLRTTDLIFVFTTAFIFGLIFSGVPL